MTGDEALFSMVFRALIVLFSYGYNIETCKIIEATFLTLHILLYARFFAGQRGGGHGPSGPMVNTLEMVITFTCKPSLVRIDARNLELSW